MKSFKIEITVKIFKKNPVYDDEIIENFGLFLTTKVLQIICSFMRCIKKLLTQKVLYLSLA